MVRYTTQSTQNIHGKQTIAQGIHGVVAYQYANSASRLAASDFTQEDLYKLCLQLDDGSLWILTNYSPISWAPVQANNAGTPGAIAYFNGTQWVNLPLGHDGYVLAANTALSKPVWTVGGSGGGGSPFGIADAGSTVSSGTVVFSNSNGITFGLSGSTLTASVLPVAVSGIGGIEVGTQTAISGNVKFANSNGITFGMSNSSVVTASYTVPNTAGLISNINVSGGTTSNNLSAITFSNSNNVSFGLNGSTITASASFNQTNQTQNVVVPSAGTQTATSGTVVFSNSNGISFGMSGSNRITASYTVPNTAGLISNINVSAGTTSNNLSAVTFSNSNGLAFGLNGSVITGSYTVPNVPAQTDQTLGLYATGNTTQNSSTTLDARSLTFQGAGVASVGYSNGSIVVSVPAGGGGGNINVSAGTTSNNLNALTFSNSNGVSFGINNSVITASIQPGAAAGIGAIQGGTQTATSGTVVFSNSNGITFGMSNSSVMTASYTVPNTAGLISNINVSAGTTSNNLTALIFSNSNNVSFGLNGSIITGSASFPVQTNQTIGLYGLGNTTQNSSTTLDARTLSFNGLGDITIGYSNGSIQISGNQTIQTQGVVAPSAGTQTATSGTVIFSNSNGLSFGMSNNSIITGSYTVPNTAGLISNINISAGTTSNNLTALTFSNSNGLAFGLNGSVITGSYTVPNVPTQTNQTLGVYALGNTTGQSSSSTLDARTLSFNGLGNLTVGFSNGSVQLSGSQSNQTQNIVVPSAGTQTATSGTVIFSNSNGISFGMSNSSVVTASYTVPSTAGLISNINISAGTTSNNLTALTFSNSNGISFGLNGSTVTASYTVPNVPAQTNQTVGLYALGNTTQNSSTTLDARTLSFNGLGNITVGYSNGSIQISGSQSNQTQSNVQGISAGTQIGRTSDVVFSNSNGISFGMSNSSVITASYTVPSTAGLISNINVSAGTTSNNLSAITFSNSNGVSFGLNGSVITATVTPGPAAGLGAAAAGTQTQTSGTLAFVNSNGVTFGMSNSSQITASVNGIALSAGTTSGNTGTIVFSNSNGVSFGMNGNTITATVTPGPAAGLGAAQAGTQTQTSGTIAFSNSNGITFGMSNSSVITASYTVPSTAGLISNINVSAGTTSNNLSALTFSNSNGLAFGLNGSTITGSYTVPTQTNQTLGAYAVGNTTGQSSSSTFDARTLSFNGAGVASVGYSNGSVIISVSSQPVNSINISAGTTSNNLTALTFSNSNGLAFGLNGSVLTGSYTVPNTAGLISNINVSAGTTSNNLSAITFSNSNGLSFGLNGSTITGSYTVPTQSNQTQGLYAVGNTTGQSSSSTFDARTITFNGAGIISVGYSNSSVLISATQSVQTQGVVAPSAGTQTATSGTVVFSNSNGISFGMSNSSVVTASYTVPNTAGLISNINVSAGTTSNNLTALTFSNSNGLAFGLNGSVITGSYTTPTQTNQTVGLYALGNTTQNSSTTLDARTLSFNGLGIITAGYSNGSIQISATQSAQTQNVVVPSAGTQTATSGTVVFSNSNGITFGMSNSSVITASYTVPTQSNQTIGAYAIGNTVGQSSSSSFDARTLSISGAGIASVGYSGNNLVISVPSAGASINFSAGTTSNNLNAITFSNSNNLSFGLNGSTITGSASFPTQTNQTIGLYALGNTTQNSSTTLDARTLSFNGLGNVTVGYSNGSIQVSGSQSVQTQGVVAPAAGTQTATSGTVVFSNSNGISFGMSNSSVVTASYTVPSTAGLISNINISAGTTSNNLTALTFSNSNGLSFGLNGSTITGSYTVPTQTNQTIGAYAIGNTTGQSSSSTFDARTLSISGAGIASVGYSGNNLVISVPAAGANINVSAGTTSNNLAAITFSNANNISFGLNASTITASASFPVQTNQTIGLYALGNTTQNSSTTLDARTLSFNGLGAATVGYSNGSIQISVPTQSVQTQSNIQALFDGVNSISTGTVRFSNSNGISFGINGQTITASHNGITTQTNQTVGLYAVGNTTGQSSSSTFDARSITFSGSGNITVGYSGGSVIIAQTGGGGQSNQTVGLYALGNTTQNSSTTLDARTLSYNGLGGMTVGYSNGSIQMSAPGTSSLSATGAVSISVNGSTVSIGAPNQTNQTIGFYALGNTTQNSSTTLDARTVSFNGLGDITVGYSNGSIQISGSQTAQTQSNVQGISAGTQIGRTGNIIFSNSNGVTFGMSNSSVVTASYTVPSTAGLISNINVSAGTTSNNLSAITFSNLNGVSFGLNGSTITASVAPGAAAGIGAAAAGTQTQTSGTLVFANSNGVTFGMSGSSQITASIQPGAAAGIGAIQAGTQTATSGTVIFSNSNGVTFGMSNSSVITGSVAAQTNQTVGLYALGNTTQNSSTTLDARTLSYNGLGGMTVGYSNGSVQMSAPVVSQLTGVNGITLSSNGSTVSISGNNPNQDFFNPFLNNGMVANQVGQGTIHIHPMNIPALQFDRLGINVFFSNTSNTTGSISISYYVGLYTRNVSTLSLLMSSSTSLGLTFSGTTNNSILSGPRVMTLGWTTTVQNSNYWVGQLSRTSSAGANATVSQFLISSVVASNFSGILGAASNATNQGNLGQGFYTATSSSLPSSIAFSQINGTLQAARQPPTLFFVNGTA